MCREEIISVIVPVYNVEAYLARCVDSILEQTYPHLDVILVDDGSKDASGAICDSYAAGDPRIRVIHKENGGLSSARNAGLDVAAGAYIAFVDSDDWLEPDAYEYMLEKMWQYGVKLVCAGRFDVEEHSGEKTLGLCPEKEESVTGEDLAGRIFTWDHCDSSVCDKLFHRSLWEKYRFPVGRVNEDLLVTYRVALDAGQAVLCHKPVYNYFQRTGSISRSTISEKTFHYSQNTRQVYEFIREHHPAILPQASFLRVRSLYHLLVTLEQAQKEVGREYTDQIRSARRELGRFTGFILKSPWFGMQERITNLLLILNLYRLLRPLFHRT